MNVGEYIKTLRVNKELTQEELGALIGVKKAAVQKWESGLVQNLKRSTIQQLSEIFGVSPVSFIRDDVPMERNEKTAPPNEDDAVVQEILNIIKALPTDKKRKFLEAIKNLASM